MSSYKEVHQIISSMPTSLSDIGEDTELEIHKIEIPEEEHPEQKWTINCIWRYPELDIMDAMEDIAETGRI